VHDVCRCRNPVRVNKVIEHMYSARPTLLTDTISHVKLSPGEGTQREGNGSALTGMPESSAFGEPDLTWINYRRGANQSATLDFCIVAHTKQTTTRFLSQ